MVILLFVVVMEVHVANAYELEGVWSFFRNVYGLGVQFCTCHYTDSEWVFQAIGKTESTVLRWCPRIAKNPLKGRVRMVRVNEFLLTFQALRRFLSIYSKTSRKAILRWNDERGEIELELVLGGMIDDMYQIKLYNLKIPHCELRMKLTARDVELINSHCFSHDLCHVIYSDGTLFFSHPQYPERVHHVQAKTSVAYPCYGMLSCFVEYPQLSYVLDQLMTSQLDKMVHMQWDSEKLRIEWTHDEYEENLNVYRGYDLLCKTYKYPDPPGPEVRVGRDAAYIFRCFF